MNPKEFAKLVFEDGDKSDIENYIKENCGDQLLEDWNNVIKSENCSEDEYKRLCLSTPPEVKFYFFRRLFLIDNMRDLVTNDDASLKEIADLRGMMVEGINDV